MSFYETASLYGLIAFGVYACAWFVVRVVVRAMRGRPFG
jgi:hypothetical protein